MKEERITITLKELLDLDRAGKLVEYIPKYKTFWGNFYKNDYLSDFINDQVSYRANAWSINLAMDGTYHIIDGRLRAGIILKYVRYLDSKQLEPLLNRVFNICLLRELT
jgi:hypothetical protein